MDDKIAIKGHKVIINNRNAGIVTGVMDVLSFDADEIILETEQGMLMIKGKDLHVNRLTLEKGEIDIAGIVDSMAYSDIHPGNKAEKSFLTKLFR